MRVLVACEESQAVCKEFRKLGHEAYSCDTLECSGGHPEWHLQRDVEEVLGDPWDMVIAFPPCTYLTNAAACRLYPRAGVLDPCRYRKGLEAREFFLRILHSDTRRVAVENPTPSRVFNLPDPSQVIQPYEYGHPYRKRTCLWLKGLPPLRPVEIIKEGIVSWVSGGSKDRHGRPRKGVSTRHRSPRVRSKTFPGIAKAMAEQWGGVSI